MSGMKDSDWLDLAAQEHGVGYLTEEEKLSIRKDMSIIIAQEITLDWIMCWREYKKQLKISLQEPLVRQILFVDRRIDN